MADDSLQFATDDTDFTAKMNRKSVVVGRGRQLNSLINTYPGQYAFCTETENGFTIDNYYRRNSANTSWNGHLAGVESAEQNTTPITDNSATTLGSFRHHIFFTLPTTEKLYIITGIEWKNGPTISGNVLCGINIMDSNPPSDPRTVLLGITAVTAQSGASSIQRASMVSCNPIRGGTLLGVWISSSDSTGTFRFDAGGGGNVYQTIAYTTEPQTGDVITWNASTTRMYLKVYYRGLL